METDHRSADTTRDYTPEEVADMLRVHRDTVYRWLKEFRGRPPILGGYRLPGSKSGWRITPEDLAAFRARYHNTAADASTEDSSGKLFDRLMAADGGTGDFLGALSQLAKLMGADGGTGNFLDEPSNQIAAQPPEDLPVGKSQYYSFLRQLAEHARLMAAQAAEGAEKPAGVERFRATIAELKAGLADMQAKVAELETDKEKTASPETTDGPKG